MRMRDDVEGARVADKAALAPRLAASRRTHPVATGATPWKSKDASTLLHFDARPPPSLT